MAFTKIVNTGIGTITDPFAVPKGTTADRPVGISSGVIRYNTTTEQFEGYSSSWGSLGGGAVGGGQNTAFFENDTNVRIIIQSRVVKMPCRRDLLLWMQVLKLPSQQVLSGQ